MESARGECGEERFLHVFPPLIHISCQTANISRSVRCSASLGRVKNVQQEQAHTPHTKSDTFHGRRGEKCFFYSALFYDK